MVHWIGLDDDVCPGRSAFTAFLAESDWDSQAFLQRHHHLFHSNYIAELFAVLAGVDNFCDPSAIRLEASQPSFLFLMY